MRVIFLDVDGVLNCYATFSRKRGGEIAIDADKVRLVTALAWRTKSHVVISSTWRKGRGAMARLRKWLTARGLPAHRIIGATPDLSELVDHLWRAPCRGDEIAAWLAHHPVESFVIFDDDADMGVLEDRLIRTEFKDGLTAEHCRRAEAVLTAAPSTVGRAGGHVRGATFPKASAGQWNRGGREQAMTDNAREIHYTPADCARAVQRSEGFMAWPGSCSPPVSLEKIGPWGSWALSEAQKKARRVTFPHESSN